MIGQNEAAEIMTRAAAELSLADQGMREAQERKQKALLNLGRAHEIQRLVMKVHLEQN